MHRESFSIPAIRNIAARYAGHETGHEEADKLKCIKYL